MLHVKSMSCIHLITDTTIITQSSVFCPNYDFY